MTQTAAANGDVIVPFQLGAGAIRGRAVKLSGCIDQILSTHHYPDSVNLLLGETIALACILAGSLKYDGIFTLQAQGDGAVRVLVADVTSDGHVRGQARFDADRVASLPSDDHSVATLMGQGYLAFTVDQGSDTDRYQGIVELSGHTLAESARQYFIHSEQLETDVVLACGLANGTKANSTWVAGGMMIQRMPADQSGGPILCQDEANDLWQTAKILLSSLKPSEILDPALSAETLIYRLYHGEQVQAWEAKDLRAQCRCSRDRISTVLRSLSQHDVMEMKDENGHIVVSCEFCHSDYRFDESELTQIYTS